MHITAVKAKSQGFSTYFLMFGREPRIPVEEAFEVTFPFRQEKKCTRLCASSKGKITMGIQYC